MTTRKVWIERITSGVPSLSTEVDLHLYKDDGEEVIKLQKKIKFAIALDLFKRISDPETTEDEILFDQYLNLLTYA